jgi:hypothetical protein
MLLSLFTDDITGEAIADPIISFSECFASAGAGGMLFICNI